MVDSVGVKSNTATGAFPVIVEKVGDEYYPIYKLATGPTGEAALVSNDNPLPVTDFYHDVAEGNIPGHSLVHKFGFATIGTSLVPITDALAYRTPQTLTSLEILSDSANDTAAGSGAREITIVGIGANWAEVTQTVATNGITAAALATDLYRVTRMYVSSSGSYAAQTTASHSGVITLRESGGGQTWALITDTPFPLGQSEIGVTCIPAGYRGYILSKSIFADTSKTADMFFFQRQAADETAAPYTGAMRLIQREIGVSGEFRTSYKTPKGPYYGPCDIGYMGKVASGTDGVSVEFELLIVQDGY